MSFSHTSDGILDTQQGPTRILVSLPVSRLPYEALITMIDEMTSDVCQTIDGEAVVTD